MRKSPNEMQINPPVVFTFTRQRWSSTSFRLLLAFDVWASNTYFTPWQLLPFWLAATVSYFPNRLAKLRENWRNFMFPLIRNRAFPCLFLREKMLAYNICTSNEMIFCDAGHQLWHETHHRRAEGQVGPVFLQISLLNFTVRSLKRRNSFDTQNHIVKKSFYNHICASHVRLLKGSRQWQRIGVGKLPDVRYWSGTMAIEVYLSFEHVVSVRNCTSVSAQYWPNSKGIF